ncbi:16S rRNA (guanine(966)-N(2))-methyltransferase RsmD [Bacillaceae bacterium Marseille-Q3522]|nr:16S rRNA (guanine(966)-N(2))-methyltransferase RsmD [Bacillaceae bacterium Marseille-Q3522]
MRVVSGEAKGRLLKAVPGSSTRPTTDKVKEAIFNMIGPYFQDGCALDLFAGSGGLGIEALSRGIEKVIFVDRDKKAILTIKENVKACQFEKKAEIYRNDAERALKAIIKRKLHFHYIFLDPPYKTQQIEKLIGIINKEGLLITGGVVVCEHSTAIELPAEIGSFIKTKTEVYGITAVSLYEYAERRE